MHYLSYSNNKKIVMKQVSKCKAVLLEKLRSVKIADSVNQGKDKTDLKILLSSRHLQSS